MRIRYGWELALAALLVIEIVAFGAINLVGLVAGKQWFNRIYRRVNPSAQAHSRFGGESLVGRRRRQCPLAKSICSTFKHG